MNQWRLILAGVTIATLCACAAQQATTKAPVESSAATTSGSSAEVIERAEIKTTDLPCAEVSNLESVQINYAGENIYRGGSALPKEEGLACLEVLADWLKGVSYNQWRVTVAGEEGYGYEPLALAGKRQQLLQRFFARKGVDLQIWRWQTVTSDGIQLQFSEDLEAKSLP